ncbi:hypothetical protein [Flammeovirga agarivorans]|uniref:Uncharacterized protein n=1 Tax=Flammeovirga agarivorans TaxID=2726742 RepID=A0A7X8XZD3_9BACT|nr:hypothetical protein [Flammeovirga agarivorans]NLR94938.1 hypothetical protein [Flammeovirga agarivorans]
MTEKEKGILLDFFALKEEEKKLKAEIAKLRPSINTIIEDHGQTDGKGGMVLKTDSGVLVESVSTSLVLAEGAVEKILAEFSPQFSKKILGDPIYKVNAKTITGLLNRGDISQEKAEELFEEKTTKRLTTK